jgi:hypothetical protein
MDTKQLVGQLVTLQSSQGLISRIVVEDLGDVITVCSPEEYKEAQRLSRQPLAIGFKKKDLARRS